MYCKGRIPNTHVYKYYAQCGGVYSILFGLLCSRRCPISKGKKRFHSRFQFEVYGFALAHALTHGHRCCAAFQHCLPLSIRRATMERRIETTKRKTRFFPCFWKKKEENLFATQKHIDIDMGIVYICSGSICGVRQFFLCLCVQWEICDRDGSNWVLSYTHHTRTLMHSTIFYNKMRAHIERKWKPRRFILLIPEKEICIWSKMARHRSMLPACIDNINTILHVRRYIYIFFY